VVYKIGPTCECFSDGVHEMRHGPGVLADWA